MGTSGCNPPNALLLHCWGVLCPRMLPGWHALTAGSALTTKNSWIGIARSYGMLITCTWRKSRSSGDRVKTLIFRTSSMNAPISAIQSAGWAVLAAIGFGGYPTPKFPAIFGSWTRHSCVFRGRILHCFIFANRGYPKFQRCQWANMARTANFAPTPFIRESCRAMKIVHIQGWTVGPKSPQHIQTIQAQSNQRDKIQSYPIKAP